MRRFLSPLCLVSAKCVFKGPLFKGPLFKGLVWRRVLPLAVGVLLAACSSIPPPPEAAKPVTVPAVPRVPAPPPAITVTPLLPPPSLPPPLPTAPSERTMAARNTTSVGLMVPLSGPSAALGTALFNAAQLALFEVGDNSVTLLPIDSTGTEDGAAAAAQQALAQGLEIVVGPLFAGETRGAAGVLRARHIPMLALTTDESLAGGDVYVLGLQPGDQALRAARYAVSENLPRLAILAPNNAYGRQVAEVVTNAAEVNGLTITEREYYDPLAAEFSASIKRLLGRRKDDDPGFDAVLIPDEGQRLRMVVAGLQAQGVDLTRTRLLGTMLWEDANGDPALAGGWYAAPPAADFADFDSRYTKAFGVKPPRLASLAYDATALAVVLARHNAHDFSARTLTNPKGYAGIDGVFRLRPDGTTERSYTVMELQAGAASLERSPAPTAFPVNGN